MSIFLVRRFLLVGVCLTLSACVNHERRYDFEGRVVSKVLATRTLVVDHENIPGFMPAMTMPYPVANGVDLSGVEAGDRIKARIVVHPDERYELDKVLVTDSTHRGQTEKETRQLYPGEPIPDVELLNQDGKTIRLSDFRGKTVLLTFIYTRCPMPTFCPRLSSLFASVERELTRDTNEYERTHLVSISIDPKFDTPAVLRKYGLAYLDDDPKRFVHWSFTVPSPENLRKLAAAFGLIYREQENQIAHSLSTVLIDPQGRLVKEWTVSDWTAPEAVAAIRQVESAKN
ncbi:MAG TPA: SCO family protein [Candidatus Sulfotelmatobacter sp.]|nr:SCO family protein [Candidatus Sulfotelmatobacter sp.]